MRFEWLILPLVVACAETVDDGDPTVDTGEPVVAADVTYADVEPIIADNCLGCHGTPPNGAPFSLDSFEAASSRSDRIVARAVDGDPTPMPPSGLALSNDEGQLLRDWDDAGAPQ